MNKDVPKSGSVYLLSDGQAIELYKQYGYTGLSS